MQVLQVQLEIRPDPAEVGRARKWARSRLARSGIGVDEPIAETLILIVSELVTNAVVHTGCPAVLRLLLRADPEAAAHGAPEQDGAGATDGPGAGRAGAVAAGGPAVAGTGAAGAGEPVGEAAALSAPDLVVGSVRVEVADTCARPPRPRPADGDATGGRGLALVDGLADRWGWEPSGGGKRIWCELDRGTAASRTGPELHQDLPAFDLAACPAV